MSDLLSIKTAVEAAFADVDLEDRILILAELTSETHVSLSLAAMTTVMKKSVEQLMPPPDSDNSNASQDES